MSAPLDQTGFWNAVAAAATFSHPLDVRRLAAVVPPGERVLDVGCGYGRTTAELAAGGWNAVGVDPAERMLRRGRRERPRSRFVRAAPGVLPFRDGSFAAATLFAVLTCIPEDGAQRSLVAEIRRALRPGGALYVSDLLLNDDGRNVARYEAMRGRGRPYGVFELQDGAVMRHHDPAWIRELFADWTEIAFHEFVATTMHGNASRAVQLLLRADAAQRGRVVSGGRT